MGGTSCFGFQMISQYRLFANTNTFYPDDLRTFGIRGKIASNQWTIFSNDVIPDRMYIYDALYDYMESLGYEHEQLIQYDAIELDVNESSLEW